MGYAHDNVFTQGKPTMPYNINDLGETLLVNKLNLNTKFTKAVTEERKKNGLFKDIRKFEERMTVYYLNRIDKEVFNSGMDDISNLEYTKKVIF